MDRRTIPRGLVNALIDHNVASAGSAQKLIISGKTKSKDCVRVGECLNVANYSEK